MDQRIIYQTENGGVAVIIPADNVPVPLTEDELVIFGKRGSEAFDLVASDPEQARLLLEKIEDEIRERMARMMTIEEIAAKDVPTGTPYKIVDVSDIPTDRTQRELWTVDVADLTDGVGA